MAKSLNKVDTDSYGSLCPDFLKQLCKHPLSLDNDYGSYHNFTDNANGFPVNVMLDIRVDLTTEHEILCQARHHAHQNCSAKKGSYLLHERDQKCLDKLTSLLKMWEEKVKKSKKRGKYVLLFSTIQVLYLPKQVLPGNCWQVSMLVWCKMPSAKNYHYFKEPLHVDFSPRFPQRVATIILDGFQPETWLLGNTCKQTSVMDDTNSCHVSPCNRHWHNNKINHCHYLDTILLPDTDSYQIITATKQVLATKK